MNQIQKCINKVYKQLLIIELYSLNTPRYENIN